MRTFSLIALSALAAIAAPAAASQGPVNSTDFSASVEHKDLDLTQRKDVSRLDDRIRTRINQMCRNGGRDSASVRLERQCRASALAAAQPEVRFAVAKANAQRTRFATNTAAPAKDAAPGA
ncbi:MAG: UrcA family protein [Pseudomonadota bacterium]